MRLRPPALLTAWIFILQTVCYAQPAGRQHLLAILQEKQEKEGFLKDTAYINALNEMAHACYGVSADSLFRYAGNALACSKKAGYSRGESNALRELGSGYWMQGDYTKTLSYYLQSLAVAERINDHDLMGKACFDIALQYIDMHKGTDAMAMAERARRYFIETGDSFYLSKSLVAIGEACFSHGQYDSAMNYFRQAYRVAENIKNTYLLVCSNDEIASILVMKGRYKEALAIYLHALEYYHHTGDHLREAMAATDVAWSYLKLGQYREVLKYGHISLRISSGLKATAQMQNVCRTLADAYRALGDYRSASVYQSRFISLADTLFSHQVQQNTARLEARYEYEKKEALLREDQVKKDIRHEAIVKTQQLEIGLAAIVIVLLSLLAHLLCRSRTAKQKANRALEAMNGEIMRQKEAIEHTSYQLLLNNQQKDKLFSIISHDLKTPLHSLNTVLDLLKAKVLSEAQINKMIEELRRDVDYSSGLVSNLLFWANSQLNGIVATPVALDLRRLVSEVFSLFAKQASDKTLVWRNDLDLALKGYADKDMIHVVMRNLVSNAVKFCRPGDTIYITGKAIDTGVEICLADTGIGITKDVLEKINGKKIITTDGTANERGTGLGIVLCREFIELNGGLFRIESTPGEGSRFFFTLPAAPEKKSGTPF